MQGPENRPLDGAPFMEEEFVFLEYYQADQIAPLLGVESPQTIALVLSRITPEKAASILERIEPDKRMNVTQRITNLESVPQFVLQTVAKQLRKKLMQVVPNTGGN